MAKKNYNLTIDNLLDKVKEYDDNKKHLDMIRKAYEYANSKHFNQKRITGDDYIQHPLNVALILTNINSDYKAICAALLHDTIEDSDGTYEEISKLFDKEVANLVECVTKINRISFTSESEQMAANQRKILVGLAEDVRVIIIKLADRLHNMRTLYVMPLEKQKKKAKETLEILTPVAHRLGIYKIKSELEDLSLRYSKPEAYYDIVEKLNLKKTERDKAVGEMLSEVSKLLDEHNIKHEIKGRSKSIYSIYTKMNKGKRFDDIYDILALRILVDTKQECYLALGLIHSKYKPVPKRFKDYIAMPKTNLYQSLHTTVFGVYGQLFEIQIRTYEMDQIAEYGIASHFAYKENKAVNTKDAMEQKLQIFRSIIELNEDTKTPEEFITSIKKDILTTSSIYVYTPKGDVIEMPEGATPVDFAYKVHSEVGDTMTGAVVNDKIVPLNYVLKTGDIIKINTNKNSKPSKDWLNFVITSQAKNKIKSYYSKLEKDENLAKGLEILEKEFRKKNMPINETLNKNLPEILEELKLKDLDELYIALGSGKVTITAVIKIIKNKEPKWNIPKIFKLQPSSPKKQPKNKDENTKDAILVEGLDDIKTTISGCCKPIPGDSIIGYITKGSGITIHRSSCYNVVNLDERLINVHWNPECHKSYPTDILIYTETRDKLVDIITKASSNNITIDRIETINKGENKIYQMTVITPNTETLDKFITALNNMKNIKKVERKVN